MFPLRIKNYNDLIFNLSPEVKAWMLKKALTCLATPKSSCGIQRVDLSTFRIFPKTIGQSDGAGNVSEAFGQCQAQPTGFLLKERKLSLPGGA